MKPLSLARPHLIVMIGIPGAGKSFFAEHFASTFKAPIVNQGKIQSEIFGTVSGDSNEAEIADFAATIALRELVKTEQTIVYEGPTGVRAKRIEIAKFANSVGYVPLFVWVQTDSSEAGRRATKANKEEGALTDEQFEDAVRHFTIPAAAEHAVVISGKHTYASQLKIVLKHLAGAREAAPVSAPAARPEPETPVQPERPIATPRRNIFIR